jgi:hypothetical protein
VQAVTATDPSVFDLEATLAPATDDTVPTAALHDPAAWAQTALDPLAALIDGAAATGSEWKAVVPRDPARRHFTPRGAATRGHHFRRPGVVVALAVCLIGGLVISGVVGNGKREHVAGPAPSAQRPAEVAQLPLPPEAAAPSRRTPAPRAPVLSVAARGAPYPPCADAAAR